jgi:hypothetical protein
MDCISATQLIASGQPESTSYNFISEGKSSQISPVLVLLLLESGEFFIIQFSGHLLPGQSRSHLDVTQN